MDVLKDFFPFGSGFASFATEMSGKYYSQIYTAYGLNGMEGFSPRNWLSMTGAYYPSLVQFGVTGILLYLSFWIRSAGRALVRFKREGDIRRFVIALTITGFVFIENLSDAFFSSNKGFFMMMFLGLLVGKYKTTTGEAPVNTGENPIATEEHRLVEETIVPPEAPAFRELPDIPPVEASKPEYEEDDDEYDNDDEYDEDNEDSEYNEDNELVKREEGDMIQSEPSEKILDIPLKDEDFNDDFPIFEPLLDEADVEPAHEITENKDIQEDPEPEKRNEDNIPEKPAAKDEETNEDEAPIDFII
ncbi:MAG: hypothetical protein LBR86_03460 [Tannerella sp.]|nr:hypothetical protein [Tannerella sp.]